jgi:hypothetical protein
MMRVHWEEGQEDRQAIGREKGERRPCSVDL